MILLFTFVTVMLAGMTGIAVINALTFPRLKEVQPDWKLDSKTESPPSPPANIGPLVSILIPARNEAAVIGSTVRRLLAQSYPNFEVIILDDQSTDGTAEQACRAGQNDSRLQVVPGTGLPPGWLGKNWACAQLARRARGEWLVFADAEVQWAPEALTGLLAEIERSRAEVITVWPTQQTEGWSERLVVPLMALAIVGYLPLPLVHYTAWPSLAAANGQCLAFHRAAYERVGGHASVRGEVLEDVLLARRAKAAGLRLRMADGGGLIGCRMYRSWSAVREGFAKNVLAGYGHSIPFLLLATIFHWLVFLGPWVWLVSGSFGVRVPRWPWWPLSLVGLGVGVRGLTAAVTRQRWLDALLMPVSVLLMTIIAAQSVYWQLRYGGPQWKGRTVRKNGRLEGWRTGGLEDGKAGHG
ncbi:MAG TPA: glycosyltransferase family 2 protein [Anaerolineae bacterium]|nr:glycosyltransferase family 2 protein [Anaerolineae bacterium]